MNMIFISELAIAAEAWETFGEGLLLVLKYAGIALLVLIAIGLVIGLWWLIAGIAAIVIAVNVVSYGMNASSPGYVALGIVIGILALIFILTLGRG
ncbi:MAG: hypothetical protein MN733_19690 [Nitrososphaera sp.]|nr:hypothetical protein [Nitrososphaera sp.]